MEIFYYTYVLKSEKDGRLYIGYTKDLKKRLHDHNSGNNKSTAGKIPLKLMYYEAHRRKNKAMSREQYFKTTKGKILLHRLIDD